MKKYWDKFVSWSNENNTEITWFFLGFFLCDMLLKIGQRDYWSALWDVVVMVLMYSTRKLRLS